SSTTTRSTTITPDARASPRYWRRSRWASGRSSSSICQTPSARCPRWRCADRRMATTDFVAAQKANRRNTLLLLIVLTGVAAVTGYVIGWALEGEATDSVPLWSRAGLVIAALLAAVSVIWSLISLVAGDKLVLTMAGAREIAKSDAPQL